VEYLKGILSGVAAVFLALCVPGLVTAFRGISEKATGLGVVVAGLTEALFSPTFWIFTAIFFGLFFAAGSRAASSESCYFGSQRLPL